MGVDHGRLNIRMPEKLLDGPDIIACLDQVGSKGVPQRVDRCMFHHVEIPGRSMNMFLEGCGI